MKDLKYIYKIQIIFWENATAPKTFGIIRFSMESIIFQQLLPLI